MNWCYHCKNVFMLLIGYCVTFVFVQVNKYDRQHSLDVAEGTFLITYVCFALFSSRLHDTAASLWWFPAASTVGRDTTTSAVAPSCSSHCPSLCCPISITYNNFCRSSTPSHIAPWCWCSSYIHPCSYTRYTYYELRRSPANVHSISGIYSCGKLHVL